MQTEQAAGSTARAEVTAPAGIWNRAGEVPCFWGLADKCSYPPNHRVEPTR
jgi:hypothetical protein